MLNLPIQTLTYNFSLNLVIFLQLHQNMQSTSLPRTSINPSKIKTQKILLIQKEEQGSHTWEDIRELNKRALNI